MDRNYLLVLNLSIVLMSLSARRAWIEIDYYGRLCYEQLVALRKESVDRNCYLCDDVPDLR